MPAGVALIVRSLPYRQRSARAQLDVALLAGAAERPLRLYFVGAAALQLLDPRDPGPAALPPGYRAWSSLPGLTEIEVFVEPEWLDRLRAGPGGLLLEARPLDAATMREDWRTSAALLVL